MPRGHGTQEWLHPFLSILDHRLHTAICRNDGASPATETAVTARRRGGVDHKRTFALLRVSIKGNETPVVAAPGAGRLQQKVPDVVRGKVDYRRIDESVGKGAMSRKKLPWNLVRIDDLISGRTFIHSNAKNHHGLTMLGDLVQNKSVSGLNFHSVRAPSELIIWSRITLAENIYPKCL